MQALQLVAWKREANLRRVPVPDVKPGEVLVRVGGAGACHSDLHLMHDYSPGDRAFELPFTLGHENAGWIEAVGAGIKGLELGTPVAVYGAWGCGHCRRCLMGMECHCEHQGELGTLGGGLGSDGGMAQYMIVPNPRYLVPIGDLDPVQAAPLTDAGLTPYHAVKRSRELLVPGTSVVVIGVGGLGHMAVQILRELTPSTIIAVDSREDALALARELGAHRAIAMGTDVAAEAIDATSGVGADLVLDFVGTDATMALGAAIARPLGRLTIVGGGGGTLPFTFHGIPYELSVSSTLWGSLPELVEVLALASAGRIAAKIEQFSLADAARAYVDMQAGRLLGRAVIVP